ncbi:TrbI/VirB10 family protein [Cupriavidus pinatubonensis]|uniref:Uncharacterized protein n=1 Tax=Cupriavidus pinatubonensis TaxID=248026 RepID=A0ABM8WRE6_9BURK|nr:TrbI/VirB10 family protein [Cupriavidus pinatubonensis]CAG9170015.1 hypothetical protein LMG23994_01777 [Cupriavidus pinatubonensis]
MADDDKKGRWGNIKAQLGDGSVRIRYFGALGICTVGAIVGFLLFRSSTAATKPDASQVATVPDVAGQHRNASSNGAQKATPAYDNLLAHENATTAAQAKQTGDSAVPVIRGGVEQKSVTPASSPAAASTPQAAPATQQTTAATQSSAEAAANQQYQEEMQRRQQEIAAKSGYMKQQVNLLITSWQPKEHQSLVVREQGKESSSPSGATTSKLQVSTAGGATTPLASARTLVKAGDPPVYGVLETSVNTDEPGPVTATIVSGPLKGTKLLGKAEVGQNAQKAGLHFTVASIPDQPNSIGIDAWAIDPETARTAMASDVDNHYFLRYGTFFASSFLAGFGDALLKGGQNQQLIANPAGTVVQTTAYTTKQMVLAGAGNVGKQASTGLAGIMNRPATITIDAGIGIGILFMADVTLK